LAGADAPKLAPRQRPFQSLNVSSNQFGPIYDLVILAVPFTEIGREAVQAGAPGGKLAGERMRIQMSQSDIFSPC
jgi:hypothetical protein